MCIINLTNSLKVDRAIKESNHLLSKKPTIIGIFICSKLIRQVIHIKQKYAFIMIRSDMDLSTITILDSMDQLTTHNIAMALARFEEVAYKKKDEI